MAKRLAVITKLLVIAGLFVAQLPGFSLSNAASADPVDELLARMPPANRVGQLFLVTFIGSDTGPTSDVAELIRDYHIGGVVLLPQNGNFRNDPDVPQQVAILSNGLQELALNAEMQQPAADQTVTARGAASTPEASGSAPGIPLFVAVDQEGDDYPYTCLREGMTALPSSLAIGATWRSEDAKKIGEIAGLELRAVGVNLLLGPSLDVLSAPRLAVQGDLAVRSFGGDAFWVGKLGQAYIEGVHQGSDGRVATVAKHFPGLGAADRRTDEEVPTVPKSLGDLRNLELAPFVTAVRGTTLASVTDALLSSHIRFRGFQGDTRQLTRPISLDPQNLQVLMSEPGLSDWRERGGLIVSDALGVPAIRRYYDPTLQSFPYKRIAQDALLAGNDVLTLRQFGLSDTWAEQFDNIKATMRFFQEKYGSDADFQNRVDQSVRRILRVKLRLYGSLDAAAVTVDPNEALTTTGKGRADVLDVAKDAITLIYPAPAELADRLPGAPSSSDDLLIFTDAREYKECAWCPSHPTIAVDALEKEIVRLYGPTGSGQIDPSRVHSVSFTELKSSLVSAPSETTDTSRVSNLVAQAGWIIFVTQDMNTDEWPAANAVKSFLRLRSDNLRDKKLVVLACGGAVLPGHDRHQQTHCLLRCVFENRAVHRSVGESVVPGIHPDRGIAGERRWDQLRSGRADGARPTASHSSPSGRGNRWPPRAASRRAGGQHIAPEDEPHYGPQWPRRAGRHTGELSSHLPDRGAGAVST